MAKSASKVNPDFVAGAVFFITLCLYFVTAAPTFTLKNMGIDGGDLLAAAFNWGVPHPSGYPTYVLLLRLFSFVAPVGDLAFRANLFSALLGALTALLIFYITLRVMRNARAMGGGREGLAVACSAFAALSLASSPLFWSQSTIAEVYTLNAFFVACLLLLALKVSSAAASDSKNKAGTVKWLTLLGFLAGLSLGNHLTMVLLLPPLAFWLLATVGWRRLISPWPALALILGLLVYVYLPISASLTPVVNWGGADSLKGFLWLTTGGPYHSEFHLFTLGVFGRLLDRIGLIFSQVNVLGVFLALVGAWYLQKRLFRLFVTTAAFALIVIAYSASYEVRDAEVYMIPVVMVFAVWAGLGLYYAADSVLTLIEERWPSYLRFRPAESLAVLALTLVPGVAAALNFGSLDLHSDRTDYKRYSELIGRLPSKAVVMVTSDEDTFGLWYMRYVERRREDVTVVVVPLIQFDWYWNDMHKLFPDRVPIPAPQDFGERVLQVAESNLGKVPVYTTYQEPRLDEKYTLEKDGDLYRVDLISP